MRKVPIGCFSRFAELAVLYGTTPEQLMAAMWEMLEARVTDTEPIASRQPTELIQLAQAVPCRPLRAVLNLLRKAAKLVANEKTS